MELRIKTIEQIKDEIHRINKEHLQGIDEACRKNPNARQMWDEFFIENKEKMNFPEGIDFPFDELYKEIVTEIVSKSSTIFISGSCRLFSSVEAINRTERYHHTDWEDHIKEKIKDYWFFGTECDDSWYFIMDKNGEIYLWHTDYNSDVKKYNLDKKINLNINFEQWLQFAFLYKDFLDQLYPTYDEGCEGYNADILLNYKKILPEISNELYELYAGWLDRELKYAHRFLDV